MLFFLIIGLGVAGGLYYGWFINPVVYYNTTPELLREDYKADYVLMVAEAYRADGDLNLAAQRLAFLGNKPPADIATESVRYAAAIRPPYAESDLNLMRKLADNLASQAAQKERNP
jgi:hypothetical protein